MSSSWLSSTPQWEHVFATAATMSDPPSGSVASPHDWDESTCVCNRCKCTSTDWQEGGAATCLERNPGDTDLTGTCPACGETYSYWGNASAQVPKCRSCSPVRSAAVDDVAYIRQRIEEIAKERQPADVLVTFGSAGGCGK